ncbi:MAG: type I secretion C-terminal target domain-containing protein, partial [Endozoicomonas sp.]
GNGIDTFTWSSGDAGSAATPAEDSITDFTTGSGGDILDLSDLLVDEESNSLDQYLHFEFSGGDTTIEISPEASGSVTQKVTLQNVDLSTLGASDADIINNLINNGNLNTD